MAFNVLAQWWQHTRGALIFGLTSGLVWGFLSAGTAAPFRQLVYDPDQNIVFQFYEPGGPLVALPPEQSIVNYTITLLQIIIFLFIIAGASGWGTWQLTRLRPRSEQQQPLWTGLDVYLITFTIGGLICVWLFREMGLVSLFSVTQLTPMAAICEVVVIILPLYMGVSVFLVWFFRLKSVRAPNWETYYPKPVQRPFSFPRFKGWRRQGGDHRPED